MFGQTDKPQFDYTLNEAQPAQSKKLAVLRYKLPAGKDGALTLYDIYQRQNAQGRVELFGRNQAFLRQQARLGLANLFVQDWAAQRFGAKAVDDLRQTLVEQGEAQALRALHGVGADMHGENPLLGRLAKQVGMAEIAAYYEARQSMKQHAAYVQAAAAEMPVLRRDIERGRQVGVAPEEIAKAEEKLRRVEAMRAQLLERHPELARTAAAR